MFRSIESKFLTTRQVLQRDVKKGATRFEARLPARIRRRRVKELKRSSVEQSGRIPASKGPY
jgi:hypothetical protein